MPETLLKLIYKGLGFNLSPSKEMFVYPMCLVKKNIENNSAYFNNFMNITYQIEKTFVAVPQY